MTSESAHASQKRATGTPGRFWVVAVAAGVAVHAVGVFLFRVDPVPRESAQPQDSYLQIAGVNTADDWGGELFSRMELMDTSPLYLPSRWNTGSDRVERLHQRRPAELFDFFPARLSFEESPAAAELLLRVEAVASPEELSLARDHFPFSSLGREDREGSGLPERFALVEIFTFSGAEPSFRLTIESGELPEDIEEEVYPAEPMLLSLHVGSAGVAESLLVIEGSGSGRMDDFFRTEIRRRVNERAALEPGYYRVEVGP